MSGIIYMIEPLYARQMQYCTVFQFLQVLELPPRNSVLLVSYFNYHNIRVNCFNQQLQAWLFSRKGLTSMKANWVSFLSTVQISALFNPLPLPPASTSPQPASSQACYFLGTHTPHFRDFFIQNIKIYLLLKGQVKHKSWLVRFMIIRCRHAFRDFFFNY